MSYSLPRADGDVILETRAVRAGYDDHVVLDGVDLSVREGEAVLIAGPNGCGKSTLLKAIIGELPLAGGEIDFLGRPLGMRPTEWRVCAGIGYLRQTGNVFPSMTVKENLWLAGLSMPRLEWRKARDVALEIFGFLRECLSVRAGVLSGGQRQALALAMVFLRPQKLYLLDEPTAGLSPNAASALLDMVRDFVSAQPQRSVVLVEHRLELLPWISRAVFLGQGRIQGETSDISQLRDSHWVGNYFF